MRLPILSSSNHISVMSAPLYPTSYPMKRSIAAHIPPELFENILEVLTLPDEIQSWSAHFVKAEKNELGRCALVCKYWAKHCQARIFRQITLRSLEDRNSLISFLESPVSHISHYLSEVVAPVEIRPPAPWVHLLPSSFEGRKLFLEVEARLDLHNQPPPRTPLRSIHHSVPRSLPSEFSSDIRYLCLSNTQFRRFTDFIHLLAELKNLRDLDCVSVSWPGDVPFLRRARTKPLHGSIQSVVTSGCSSDWAAIYALIELRPPELGLSAQAESGLLLASIQDVTRTLGSTWVGSRIQAVAHIDDIDYSTHTISHLHTEILTCVVNRCNLSRKIL